MNVLDENIDEPEWQRLKRWRIPVRQIGRDIGRSGLQDPEIIPLLHRLSSPTFFTRDRDFCDFRLAHHGYCLVFLDVVPEQAAEFVRRVLRHPKFDTKSKRMGTIISATPDEVRVFRLAERSLEFTGWQE